MASSIHGYTTKSSFGGTKTQNGIKSLKANGQNKKSVVP